MADIRVVDGLICRDERRQFKLNLTWQNMIKIGKNRVTNEHLTKPNSFCLNKISLYFGLVC
jgi:hypothetical protein